MVVEAGAFSGVLALTLALLRHQAKMPLQLRPIARPAASETIEQSCHQIHAERVHVVVRVMVRLLAKRTGFDYDFRSVYGVSNSLGVEELSYLARTGIRRLPELWWRIRALCILLLLLRSEAGRGPLRLRRLAVGLVESQVPPRLPTSASARHASRRVRRVPLELPSHFLLLHIFLDEVQ